MEKKLKINLDESCYDALNLRPRTTNALFFNNLYTLPFPGEDMENVYTLTGQQFLAMRASPNFHWDTAFQNFMANH